MRKTKVFYGNQHVKDIYLGKTKWQVFKYKVSQFFRRLMQLVALALLVFVGLAIGRYFYPSTVVNVQEKRIEVDNLTNKVEELKNKVLDDLRACESGTIKESDGLIVFDSNKRASIGNFQFQTVTVQHYYKVLYQKEITTKEAILIALDEAKARSLARDIIFNGDSKGIDNWYNCKNKKGLSENVKWIKIIEN